MSASLASPPVLLNRIFNLRESCQFILINDTFIQSAALLNNEIAEKARHSDPNLSIFYLSFETVVPPSYIIKGKDQFINLLDKDFTSILSKLPLQDEVRKLIIIDSLNYISHSQIIQILKLTMSPNHTVCGVYHIDIPDKSHNSPSTYSYLHFLSNCVFEIKPTDAEDPDSFYNQTLHNGPKFPISKRQLQSKIYHADLTYRRKSGRSLEYKFIINSSTHEYELIKENNNKSANEEDELLKDLTTFNLGTTQKQKAQREKVDLPFLEAQKSMGSVGGSIVYEFEKDDDYDEEDPYEDPF